MTTDLKLIFIGGAPRSGTSLVQKMLDLHPDIYAGPELDYIPKLSSCLMTLINSSLSGRYDAYGGEKIIRDYAEDVFTSLLQKQAKAKGVKIISEKSPSNILEFQKIHGIIPNAYFIEVVRHPMDVLASMKEVKRKQDKPLQLREEVGRIINHRTAGKMFQFSNGSSRNSIRINYEDVVSQPSVAAKLLCDFIGVEMDNRMLQTQSSTDGSLLVDHESVKGWYNKEKYDRAVDTKSVNRWKQDLNLFESIFSLLQFKRHGLLH